jgi:2-desacetyl-2-hydroxyethyl bacteriochlorophyllide A dehydrogenase
MKALRYYGARDIRCESMDDPTLQSPRDAIVKVDKCAICGSDLHIYHGHGFSEDIGYCVGHEAVGEVVEVGRAVSRLKVGDKVMISAAVGCGSCAACLVGNVVKCATNSGSCYGLSAALQGCQAEAVRVPAADTNAALIPEGISIDQALMMTDSLATAWFGARQADIVPGSSVAVVGLGPIGLMAVESAFAMGASIVYAIDLVPERRALAAQLGAVPIDPEAAPDLIREATKGRMVDCVVEAVGVDATISLSLRLAARRGTVSVIGVAQSRKFTFPISRAFGQGLTFRIGTCSVPEEWPALIPLIQSGRLKPERYISHVLPLSDGAKAYALFDARAEGALKMVLTT